MDGQITRCGHCETTGGDCYSSGLCRTKELVAFAALDALYKLYRANNDLKKLYDVLQRLHDASPNEIGITANLARLGLNIDQNTKQSQELARQAYDRAPDDVSCAVTYAFSLYAQGRTTEGLEILQKLPPEALHESHAAVYAAVLLLDVNQTD